MDLKETINQPGVQRVLKKLSAYQVNCNIRIFDTPAHQASEAAALLGCTLGAIVKSLVFVKKSSNTLFLVLVSGINRVDLKSVGKIVNDKVVPAPPEFVLLKTGYPVGAVPPIGFNNLKPVIMDIELAQYEEVWASAGAKNILMGISTKGIQTINNGQFAQIKINKR